ALGKTNKGHHTLPNVWFVGVVPRRNPELVVAVLWEHGEFSYYPARLGARFVAAYVEKQRRLANNLVPVKAPAAPPVEVGAVWTTPNPAAGKPGQPDTKLQAGKFYVGGNGAVTSAGGNKSASSGPKRTPAGPAKNASPSIAKPDKSAQIKGGEPA